MVQFYLATKGISWIVPLILTESSRTTNCSLDDCKLGRILQTSQQGMFGVASLSYGGPRLYKVGSGSLLEGTRCNQPLWNLCLVRCLHIIYHSSDANTQDIIGKPQEGRHFGLDKASSRSEVTDSWPPLPQLSLAHTSPGLQVS